MKMPPKEKEEAYDGYIRNMYECIPKKYLDNAFNPNYESHKVKLPFRCVVKWQRKNQFLNKPD
jgi:hypothetical protein